MSISVSTFYLSKLESTVVNSTIKRFTFNGSDLSAKVISWGTITHTVEDIMGSNFTVTLENASQTFSNILTEKHNIFQEGKFEYGFVNETGSEDLEQYFGGNLVSLVYDEHNVTYNFEDKLARLIDRKVGSNESPISYVSSDYNPADIAWWVCTSYGGYSVLQSTNNPDIDYESWVVWHDDLANDSWNINANFTGESVIDALGFLMKITDSTIYDEGDNKLNFRRWTGINSQTFAITDSQIIDNIELELNGRDMINKVKVSFGYDPVTASWSGSVITENTESVNSYGIHEDVFENTHVWYISSATAIKYGERIVYRRFEPNLTARMTVPFPVLNMTLGDTIYLSTAVHSFFQEGFLLTHYELDFNANQMKSHLSKSLGKWGGRSRGFLLDDASWGLLDQDYNPLL